MRTILAVLISAALLLWPAALNGYPLMFGDSAVYLRDGMQLHVSWPRPLFYGLFERALDLHLTLWPVVVAQALITAILLRLVIACFLPGLPASILIPVTAVLAAVTSLPWFVSQLMPDLFGALMLLALGLLLLTPERLGAAMKLLLVLFAAGAIMTHQTFVPIAVPAAAVFLLARAWLGERVRWGDVVRGAAPPILALIAATAVNVVLIGQASPSPYGKLFLLTRTLLDGPGERVLQRECPRPDWTLCAFKDQIPPTAEAIQFGDDGLFTRAGGYKVLAPQVWPIVLDAIKAEPLAMLVNSLRNSLLQFGTFRSGDWLIVPMPDVTEFVEHEFPAEAAQYAAGRQARLLPLLPDWLQAVHLGFGTVNLAVLAIGALVALRRRETLGGLYAAILVTLVVNAALSGALSGVHDRYQSRFVWLATFAAMLMLLAWWRQLNRDRIGVAAYAT